MEPSELDTTNARLDTAADENFVRESTVKRLKLSSDAIYPNHSLVEFGNGKYSCKR